MPPGRIARRLLGRNFEAVGNVYRRFFVDLERVVDVYERELPQGAVVLDIGGGDGALMDRLLNRRPDLAVTMCDLATSIGSFLSRANRPKVQLFPATDFAEMTGPYYAVMISDVIHHIPMSDRGRFFEILAQHCNKWSCRKLILKDIEPRGLRAKLAVLTDRYVTGDRHVVPFSRANFAEVAARYFPEADRSSDVPDWPNYCEVLSW